MPFKVWHGTTNGQARGDTKIKWGGPIPSSLAFPISMLGWNGASYSWYRLPNYPIMTRTALKLLFEMISLGNRKMLKEFDFIALFGLHEFIMDFWGF